MLLGYEGEFMNIERIEYGSEKTGIWSLVAFISIILLTVLAAGLTVMILLEIISSSPSVASTRSFIEHIGRLLAYLLFVLGTIIYLYVKGILQDEYVTTLE
jgi:hypothetical protein